MKALHQGAILALFLAIFVTPSGLLVNELGQIVSVPKVVVPTADPLVSYKADPKKYHITTDIKGCTQVYSHPPGTMAGHVVYVTCPK